MKAFELKNKYFEFFMTRGHQKISSASLVPENDPTVLFTTAGMHPLVPYILGQEHPAGKQLVNCQPCLRTNDIDEVGDQSHLTFFQMLGNWSLGTYFKQEAIEMSFEFLTDSRWLNISKDDLAITVYEGDADRAADEESARIWESLGIARDKIFFLGMKHNWWGPAGQTGPCGPDSEMFIDTRCNTDPSSTPASDDGRYLEIWNNVFMQYNKNARGDYEELARKCVDTGMGLERTVAVLQKKSSVYHTELFAPIIQRIESITGLSFQMEGSAREEQRAASEQPLPAAKTEAPHTSAAFTEPPPVQSIQRAMRIIADHLRASVFLLGDERQILPSNLGQGYVLRRLIRRSMRFGRQLGIDALFLCDVAEKVLEIYAPEHPQFSKQKDEILRELASEEKKFTKTLEKGEREFQKLVARIRREQKTEMGGDELFHLYDTYGFPVEITTELAEEAGITVDTRGFERAFEKHQQISKSDEKQVFKGGLLDASEETTRLHTATHLLHQALRDILGSHVSQKGSNITKDRLRFDFSHSQKMSIEELRLVEELVNQKIVENLPVRKDVMSIEDAKKEGALAFFQEKYDSNVTVYSIGNFSKEVCGGPHVSSTACLGTFKIVKEQSSAQGVRRIKAVLTAGS